MISDEYLLLHKKNILILDKIPSDLKCFKCQDILIDACTLKCGCLYCRSCILQGLKDPDSKCVGSNNDCKRWEFKNNVVNDHIINKVKNLNAKCLTCRKIFQIKDIKSHNHDKHKLSDKSITNVSLATDQKKFNKISDVIMNNADICIYYLTIEDYESAYKMLLPLASLSDSVDFDYDKIDRRDLHNFLTIFLYTIKYYDITCNNKINNDFIILILTIYCDLTDNSKEFCEFLFNHSNFIYILIDLIDKLLKNLKLRSIQNQILKISAYIFYNISCNNFNNKIIYNHIDFDLNSKEINYETKLALSICLLYNDCNNDGKYSQFIKTALANTDDYFLPFTRVDLERCLKCYTQSIDKKCLVKMISSPKDEDSAMGYDNPEIHPNVLKYLEAITNQMSSQNESIQYWKTEIEKMFTNQNERIHTLETKIHKISTNHNERIHTLDTKQKEVNQNKWHCDHCTFMNEHSGPYCDLCEIPKSS